MLNKVMTRKEFEDMCKELNNSIRFSDLFELKCKRCGSTDVEIFGSCDYETGYYDDVSVNGKAVVKCHKCGNAKYWDLSSYSSDLDQLT